MKNLMLNLIITLFAITNITAQKLMPYTIGEELSMTMTDAKSFVSSALTNNNFEILGSYQVAEDDNRWLYVVTSPELRTIVEKLGKKSGFIAALRVGITIEDNLAIVSYTTPAYWASAYLRSDYSAVDNKIENLITRFQSTFTKNKPFGSVKGITSKSLQSYHYMIGMPYFDDDVTLGEYSNYKTAIQHIDNKLNTNPELQKVYEISFPNQKIKLYGIEIKGAAGESNFLPIIDTGNTKHTAFLPYELLVYENQAYMLHGRYRIALSFPDLTMGTFMKIMSTPGDIETALKKACE